MSLIRLIWRILSLSRRGKCGERINNIMDYLTKYYKNLSEQLQEKVNNLQKLLNDDEDYKDILRARPHWIIVTGKSWS